MSSTFIKNLAGVSLASFAIALAAPASAQLAPGAMPAAVTASSETEQTATAPTGTDPGISSLNDLVLVEGDPEAIAKRSYEPLPVRAMNQNDRISKVTHAAWLKHGWSEQSYQSMRKQNVGLCQKTTYFTQRFATLADKYKDAAPRVLEFAIRYDKMRRKIKTAGTFRTIGNILQIGIASALFTPAYGAVVAAGSIGGEITGRASTKQQLLANEAGQFNNELTGYHIEFNLLSLELYTDYLEMINGYCTAYPTVVSYNGTAPVQQ